MRSKNRLGRYLIGMLVFLCCTTTAVYAQINKNAVLNATVFIDTDVSNGTGFYVQPNLIATSFNIISGATEIDVYLDEHNIGFIGVVAYDAKRNLALLQVRDQGTPLRLSRRDSPQPWEPIYVSASLSSTDKRFKVSETVPHQSKDFCQAGVKFPIIAEINSDGGPALDVHIEVRGIFFIGMFKREQELAELNATFIVPVRFLRNLIQGTLTVKSLPINVELDYCTLISRANARIRKANRSGYIDAQKLRKFAKADLDRAAKLFAKVKKIPVWRLIKYLNKIL